MKIILYIGYYKISFVIELREKFSVRSQNLFQWPKPRNMDLAIWTSLGENFSIDFVFCPTPECTLIYNFKWERNFDCRDQCLETKNNQHLLTCIRMDYLEKYVNTTGSRMAEHLMTINESVPITTTCPRY